MSWKEMILGCVITVCIAAVCWVTVTCMMASSIENCDRRAEMLEKIAAEQDGMVLILGNRSAP